MKLEIDVELPVGSEGETFGDYIAEACTRELARQFKETFSAKMDTFLLEAGVKTQVREQAHAWVAEKLAEPVTITDGYGEKKKTTTVRDLALEAVDSYCNCIVNANTGGDYHYGDRETRSRLDWLIRDTAKKAIEEQVGVKVRAEIARQVREALSAKMGEIIASALDVKK